jgi:hypothetical protein
MLFRVHGETPTLTLAEQEVIEALLRQDAQVRVGKRLVIQEIASMDGVHSGDSTEKAAADLRRDARDRDSAFKEALEDFLAKNKTDTRIVFPTNPPVKVELVSKAIVNEIFSQTNNAKIDGWDLFYKRFPNSSGLITISRVGIDPKGTVAIIYLGQQSHWLSGGGRIRVLKREGKKWVLTRESIGAQWVS